MESFLSRLEPLKVSIDILTCRMPWFSAILESRLRLPRVEQTQTSKWLKQLCDCSIAPRVESLQSRKILAGLFVRNWGIFPWNKCQQSLHLLDWQISGMCQRSFVCVSFAQKRFDTFQSLDLARSALVKRIKTFASDLNCQHFASDSWNLWKFVSVGNWNIFF